MKLSSALYKKNDSSIRVCSNIAESLLQFAPPSPQLSHILKVSLIEVLKIFWKQHHD